MNGKRSCLEILVLIILFTWAIPSFAQDEEESSAPAAEESQAPKAVKKSAKNKRTEVNFEDQLIKGEVQKPELFYLLQKKQFNFSKLIKLRENFLPEMKKTAVDVPRGVED